MSANFTPDMTGYKGLSPFRFWCQKTLPLVYDDSLSYYELLCKVVSYINNLITDVAAAEENVDKLLTAYNQLQEYVNNYFDGEDFQQKIDDSLDRYAEDGTLSSMVNTHVSALLPYEVGQQIGPVVDEDLGPVVDLKLPAVVESKIAAPVATQLPAVVQTQIGDVVGNQIGDVVADQIDEVVADQITDAVSPLVHDEVTGLIRPAVSAELPAALQVYLPPEVQTQLPGAIGTDLETIAPPVIEDWLDAHPEATTSVPDGSISFNKLATDLQRTAGISNNYFPADFTNEYAWQVNQYAVYQGRVYRCIKTTTAGQSWNASEWTTANMNSDLFYMWWCLNYISQSITTIDSSPATSAHEAGEYFIYYDGAHLYRLAKASSNIAVGDNLTPNGNFIYSSVANMIADLKVEIADLKSATNKLSEHNALYFTYENKNVSNTGVESDSTTRVSTKAFNGDGSDYQIAFAETDIGTIIYEIDDSSNYTIYDSSKWSSGGSCVLKTRYGYTYRFLFRRTTDATITVEELKSIVSIKKNPSKIIDGEVLFLVLSNLAIGAGGIETYSKERLLSDFFQADSLNIDIRPGSNIGYYIAEYTSDDNTSFVGYVVDNWNGVTLSKFVKLDSTRYYKFLFKITGKSIIANTDVIPNISITRLAQGDLYNEIQALKIGTTLSNININVATGDEMPTDYRVTTGYIEGDDTDLVIEIPTTLKIYALTYKTNSTTPIDNSIVWNTATKQVYHLFKGYRYRFVFQTVPETKFKPQFVLENAVFSHGSFGTVIPSYWESYIDNAIATINNKNETGGANADSFVFITDMHISGNRLHSPALIKEILKKTSTNKIVNGGDIVAGYKTVANVSAAEDEIKRWDLIMGEIEYPVRGNHDHDATSDGTIIIPDAAYFDMKVKPALNKLVANKQVYSYYDNNDLKIRYIFTDSGSGANTALNETQLNWLKARMTELDSSWGIIICQHMVFLEHLASDGTTEAELSVYGVTLKNAILDVLGTMDAELIAVVAGHTHRDYVLTDSGILFISTTCDMANGGTNSYDINFPNRTLNTVNEQAFDVYTVNRSEKKIYTTRIGAGENRIFDYNPDSETFGQVI